MVITGGRLKGQGDYCTGHACPVWLRCWTEAAFVLWSVAVADQC